MTLHRLLTEGTECLQKAGEPEAALDAGDFDAIRRLAA